MRNVLTDVARVGPFFAVSADPAEGVDPTWRPLAELGTSSALAARVDHVGRVLSEQAGAPVAERVAASIAVQGLAARFLSAPLAAAALHGVLPGLDPATLHWRVSMTGPWPLWSADPERVRPAAGLPALVAEIAEPLVEAAAALVPVSRKVLWGNVGSSVAGAERVLAGDRPPAALRTAELAAAVLDHPLLAATGMRRPPAPPDTGWTFRRRSCCLYYRIPGGGTCGDCVLGGRVPGGRALSPG
ncbi:(2Fe-2S)-binding protein [Pseudonocardia ailaonensis]